MRVRSCVVGGFLTNNSVLALGLTGILISGCPFGTQNDDRRASRQETAGPWVVTSPREPVSFDADQTASSLFAALPSAAHQAQHRKELAARYAAMQYLTLAAFYRASASYVETGRVPGYEPTGMLRGRCTPKSSQRDESVGNEDMGIRELQEALKAARAMEQQMPGDCRSWIRWAEIVRTATIFDLDTSAEERERAARLLLTLADDGGIFPAERDSAAEVYFSLAQFFAEQSDYVSAHAAIEIARIRSSEVFDRTVFLSELDRLKSNIAQNVRAHSKL